MGLPYPPHPHLFSARCAHHPLEVPWRGGVPLGHLHMCPLGTGHLWLMYNRRHAQPGMHLWLAGLPSLLNPA